MEEPDTPGWVPPGRISRFETKLQAWKLWISSISRFKELSSNVVSLEADIMVSKCSSENIYLEGTETNM
ncbi:Hypothetical predicted protein [Podarcis lilfordi]|uniref:Uncharacterized protein n=1 Tax=Podarcis lilfordi TaxID=74358 RepID=A0AA35NWV5_9SAUR|nr:Hypothetical predicted protein [Podarcis lilfordi]